MTFFLEIKSARKTWALAADSIKANVRRSFGLDRASGHTPNRKKLNALGKYRSGA